MNTQEYERELLALGVDKLFERPDLKKHLQQLLRQWFGTLPQPNEFEWNQVRRMLRSPELRSRFLNVAVGNEDWFGRLVADQIPRWLREIQSSRFDSSLNALWSFLISFADSKSAQPQITALLAPYFGQSEQWDNLLKAWVGRIRQWHCTASVRLYEQSLLRDVNSSDSLFMYHLRDVAKQHPAEGCRILNQILARIELPARPTKRFMWTGSFWQAFADRETGGLKIDDEILNTLAEVAPQKFLEAVWAFFLKVISVSSTAQQNGSALYFPTDAFQETWSIRTTRGVMHQHDFGFALSNALEKALNGLAETNLAECHNWLQRLEEIRNETPQMLVLDVYRKHPSTFPTQALSFLTGDARRLELGDSQWETRRLLREVAPFWSSAQCAEMEQEILKHTRLEYYLRLGLRKVRYLQQRGIEQWGLLSALGRERLTMEGRLRMREWDNKFRGQTLPDEPILGQSGFVDSPIRTAQAEKMSDRSWIRAMGKYKGNRKNRREFLQGGAEQLCEVLRISVQKQPERFAKLFLKEVPLDVDAFYAKALLKGLADSTAPSDVLFDAVRHLRHHSGPDLFGDLPSTIADIVNRRANEGLPADLLELMRAWVDHVPPGRFDENYYSRQANEKLARLAHGEGNPNDFNSFSGVAMDYLNCSRGRAISAIFRSLEAAGELEQQWKLADEMCAKPSGALRVGGLEGLLSICHHDASRSMCLFARLCAGHAEILRTEYAHRFLSWAIWKVPAQCRNYIEILLHDPFDSIKRTGAELASVLALQPNLVDLSLIEKLKSGPLPWQEGLVEVASNSVTHRLADDTLTACTDILRWAFQQSGGKLSHRATRFFYRLEEEHLDTLRTLLEDYVSSAVYDQGDHNFHEFLLRFGDLEPDWTLTQVRNILRRSDIAERGFYRLGGEELTRCVLRLYNLAPGNTAGGQQLRAQAMNAFGELLEKSPAYADRVLKEWDDGHDGRFS